MDNPVAWMVTYGELTNIVYTQPTAVVDTHYQPLYAVPPQRKWVGLTDEEVGGLTVFKGLHHIETPLLAEYIRHIEAKLKEKNGG